MDNNIYDKFFIGTLLSLIRTMIRPFFSIALIIWDFIYFTEEMVFYGGESMSSWTPEKVHLLLIINIIILVFWFGERALKNSGVLNLIERIVDKFLIKN